MVVVESAGFEIAGTARPGNRAPRCSPSTFVVAPVCL